MNLGVWLARRASLQHGAFYLNEEVSDKLKILDYESTFCEENDMVPFPKTYFAMQSGAYVACAVCARVPSWRAGVQQKRRSVVVRVWLALVHTGHCAPLHRAIRRPLLTHALSRAPRPCTYLQRPIRQFHGAGQVAVPRGQQGVHH